MSSPLGASRFGVRFSVRCSFMTFACCIGLTLLPLSAAEKGTVDKAPPDGNATIRAAAGSSEIVITTTSRLAGAVHVLDMGRPRIHRQL